MSFTSTKCTWFCFLVVFVHSSSVSARCAVITFQVDYASLLETEGSYYMLFTSTTYLIDTKFQLCIFQNLSLILQNTAVYLSVCIPHTLKALMLVVLLVFKLHVVSLVSSDRILHTMANS